MEELLNNPWTITIIGGVVVLVIGFLIIPNEKSKGDYSTRIQAGSHISAGGDIIVGSNNKNSDKDEGSVKIKFADEKVTWAKYAVGRWVWPSFRVVLLLNNFENSSSEYIRAYMTANSNDGKWEAKHFVFLDRENESNSKPNEDFRIEPGYKEKVALFLSNYEIGLSEPKPIPDIDRDSLKLHLETESGKKFVLNVKPAWIMGE